MVVVEGNVLFTVILGERRGFSARAIPAGNGASSAERLDLFPCGRHCLSKVATGVSMQASQWTTEVIVISVLLAVASAVIGYVISALRQGRGLSQLSAQLDQAQQDQGAAEAENKALQAQLSAAQAQSHALQVERSRLQAQLGAAADLATRLSNELQERK